MNIPVQLLDDVQALSAEKSKIRAFVIALEDFVRSHRESRSALQEKATIDCDGKAAEQAELPDLTVKEAL